VALWDQQGCLSPQLCYVESGGRVSPAQFATLLGRALGEQASRLPPRRLSFDEHAAVQRFRQEAEWNDAPGASLLASTGTTDWSISIEPDTQFAPTCLNRCLRLKIVASADELIDQLAPHRHHLEAAGVAVGPERAAPMTTMLAACGVHRICPIGTMQTPTLTWRQGGRPRVGEWVEWTVHEDEA